MNKNPFVPQPTYNPPQPPLPPGPPAAAQPDYSAYWAAAAAAQHQHQVQQPTTAYGTPWTAPQPPRPPPEQSALYANYGYGGQTLHWQQRQQHQQPYQSAPPMAPPPPPPQAQPQPQYNPYHASAGFQAYVPQTPQPVMSQPTYQQPHQAMAPPQPYFPQQPPQQPRPSHGIHHTPPQHLPPAKRQRFDGPSGNQPRQSGPPPQPQFQPPPPPPNTSMYGQGQNQQGANQIPLGGSRGGMSNRGGPTGGGRGKGPVGGRGGMSGQRGRGNVFMGSGAGRGGGQQGSLRGHGSRGGFGKQDFHGRRGGSFNAGHHQGNMGGANFRGRSHGQGRSGRQDGPGAHIGNRDASMGSIPSGGKKDENRRTLTDFKIVGLEMPDLGWTWGVLPVVVKAEEKEVAAALIDPPISSFKQDSLEADSSASAENTEPTPKGEGGLVESADSAAVGVKAESSSVMNTAVIVQPPSRIRIYFHTPVSPDDSHPIPHNSSFPPGATPMDSRKGKRKKLEDDDVDAEEGRERPPLPHGSQMSDTASNEIDGMGRASAAPSVAETASDGDWLMAAIAEGEADVTDADAHGDDEDQLCVSQVEDSQTVVTEAKTLDAEPSVAGDGNPNTGGLFPSLILHEASDNAGVEEPHKSVLPDPCSDAVDTQPDVDDNLVLPEVESDVTIAEATQPGAVDEKVDNLFNSPLVESSHLASQSSVSLSSSFDVGSSRASATPAAQSDMPRSAKEQSADHAGHGDSQFSSDHAELRPLQAFPSLTSTILDDAQDGGLFSQEEEAASQPGGDTQPTLENNTTIAQDNDQEHLPEPPASPTSNTLLSTSSSSTYGDSTHAVTVVTPKKARVPSANRLSISYAAGTKRLVIDAEVVQYLRVYRTEGRIEVCINLEKEGGDEISGVVIEGLSEAAKSYSPLPMVSDTSMMDETIPPFWNNPLPSKTTLIVYLDTDRPLSEPKWVKSGDVQEWLKSIFGRMFWVTGDAADGWEKKIEVTDPDPAPTIWTVLDGWAINSPVGVQTERQRFLKTHMTEVDNLLEILLRLVRGERATPFSQSTPAISAPSISGPLLTALTQSTGHGAQQTHVSLAVLAIFYMALDYAQRANGEKGKSEAEERVGEIIRCLPSHLIYKSLDGIFKEWRADKKGTR